MRTSAGRAEYNCAYLSLLREPGFLGSGKTTLVNHLLREPGGRRIAVIENEVGAISIDHDLLK